MPEASIDEYSYASFCESDIRPHEPLLDPDWVVLPKSIAGAVQQRSHRDLWLCVLAADGGHVARAPRCRDVPG